LHSPNWIPHADIFMDAKPTTPIDRVAGAAQILKVVFVSPFNLLDPSSGAAQSMRTMLEQLALRGVLCHAVTACCFDVPPGAALPQFLQAKGLLPNAQASAVSVPIWKGNANGVSYHVMQTPNQLRNQLTAVEEMLFRDELRVWLAENRPDVVLTFGGLLLDVEIHRCARAAGAIVAFYLANPSYGRHETFTHVDTILTNSAATAEHYARKLSLHCHNVGTFVDTAPIVATQRDPQFVTFINPLPEKGVTLFLMLVARAAREAPDMRFLVVESRGSLQSVLQKLGYPTSLLERVVVLPQQEKMATVYANTRVLLAPSFWFESSGRVLIEANANGIPVLATNRGGIPETLGDAGCLLPIPDRCAVDYWAPLTEHEVQPWWTELSRLWRDTAYYETLSRRAFAVAVNQSIGRQAERVEALLRASLNGRSQAATM
jgi:glycosyltransferase involved in cell wall biosynthesis